MGKTIKRKGPPSGWFTPQKRQQKKDYKKAAKDHGVSLKALKTLLKTKKDTRGNWF